MAEGCVYFIECPAADLVKIGRTKNLAQRFSDLKTSSPLELRIAGVIPDAGKKEEARLHARYDHLRVRGEWFRRAPELLEFIRNLENGPEVETPSVRIVVVGAEGNVGTFRIEPEDLEQALEWMKPGCRVIVEPSE